jgi:hypothetical protein
MFLHFPGSLQCILPLFLFIARCFLWFCFRFPYPVAVLSFDLFFVRLSIYYPSSMSCLMPVPFTVFLVPIDLFLSPCVFYSFGKPFPARVSVCSVLAHIGLLSGFRSVSFLPVHFLSLGLFPVLCSVSSPSVCYVSAFVNICLYVFLSIGLFTNCRSISRPSVCFRTVGSVSCPSPDLPVGLFPVRWSVSCPSNGSVSYS